MGSLTLRNRFSGNSVMIENEFIDHYMAKANGEYVKVYLLLLRHLNYPSCSLTISGMADALENTEKDIVRALNYWAKEGLLSLDFDGNGSICGLEIGRFGKDTKTELAAELPEAIPSIRQYKNRKELKQVLFVAEQYLGKTLSKTEVDTITYFFDTLGLSADLIEYLIEYCVENGHKSMHYIQSVALAWADQGITTVDQAKSSTSQYNKNCYSILNAFGIKGRAPAAIELTYIKRWTDEYALALDIIIEACNRTMTSIHQPNFEYTDVILKNWIAKDVHHLSDISVVDEEHKKKLAEKKPAKGNSKEYRDKFNNFDGREYDMDELERKLLSNN